MDNWNLVQQQNPCDYLVFLMTYFQDHPQKSLSVVRGFIKKPLCLSLFFFDDVFWEKEFGEKEVGEKEVEVSLEVIVSTQSAWPLPPQRGQPLSSTSLPIRKHSRRFSWNFQQFDFLLTVSFCLWFRILEFSLDFFSLSPSVLIQDMLDQRHCWYLERSQH